MDTDDRISFRATPVDLANLAAVGAALHQEGRPFATRTDALRHALAVVAGRFVAEAGR